MELSAINTERLHIASLSILLVLPVVLASFYWIRRYGKGSQGNFSIRANLVLMIIFGLGQISYFLQGEILGGDAHSHMARAWLYADLLSHGDIPIWTNKWYMGYPTELYYGFLYYLLVGITSVLTTLSPLLVTKIVLAILHAASGVAFFHLAFVCCKSRIAALFASLFYVYSFQHIGTMVLAGALPLSLIFLLLPLLLKTLDKINEHSESSQKWQSLLAAIFISLLFFSHIQYGIYSVLTFFAVAFFRICILIKQGDTKAALITGKFLWRTSLGSAIFSGWFLIPLAVEKQFLLLSNESPLNNLLGEPSWSSAIHAVKRILVPSRTMNWTYFYFGCIPLAIAVAGLLRLFSRTRPMDPVFSSYAITLIISAPLAVSSRYINIWFLLMCLMAAWGAAASFDSSALQERPNKAIKKYAHFLLIALLLGELSLTLFHWSNHSLPKFDLPEKHSESGRLAVLDNGLMTMWRSLDVVSTGYSSIFGGIPQNSTKTHPYVAAICTKAAVELLDNNESLSPLSLRAFRTLNVSQLVLIKKGKQNYPIADSTPAIFSEHLAVSNFDHSKLEAETWDSVLTGYEKRSLDYPLTDAIFDKMEIDEKKPLAKTIVMSPSLSQTDLPDGGGKTAFSADADEAEFEIINWHETNTTFEMEFFSTKAGFIQLSYSYYPYLLAKMDAKPIKTYQSALGLLVLSIPEGRHNVIIEAGLSPLRIQLLIFSFICVSALFIFWLTQLYKYRKTVETSNFKGY